MHFRIESAKYKDKLKQNPLERIPRNNPYYDYIRYDLEESNTFRYIDVLQPSYHAVCQAEKDELNLMRQRISCNNENFAIFLSTDLIISVIAFMTFYVLGLVISNWLLLGMIGVVVLGGAVAVGIDLLFSDHDGDKFDYIETDDIINRRFNSEVQQCC